MRKLRSILFFVFLFLLTLLPLQSCDEEVEKVIVGIEISTDGAKLSYKEGEVFDTTGLKVSLKYNNGDVTEINDFQVDKLEPLKLGDTKVVVSYAMFKQEIEITVTSDVITVEDIEIIVDNEKIKEGNLSKEALSYKILYSNGEKSDVEYSLSQNDVKSLNIEEDKIVFDLDVLVVNKMVQKTVEVDIREVNFSLKSFKESEIGTSKVVKGTIIGIGHANSAEVILIDEETGEMIGVQGMTNGKVGDYSLDLADFKIGDKVIATLVLNKTNAQDGSGDLGKIFAKIDTDAVIGAVKVGEGNPRVVKEKATTISSQEELVSFLNAENRPGSQYQLVKLTGKVNFISYLNGTSFFYRFFFDPVRTYADQCIDGATTSPVFFDNAVKYSTGKSFGEIVFSQEGKTSTDWANPIFVNKEIYCVFVGGNTYYHQFVLLNEKDITDGAVAGVQMVSDKVNVIVGDTLDVNQLKLKVNYQYGAVKEVNIEPEWLTSPLSEFNTIGDFEVNGKYEDFDFSFTVTVINEITNVELINKVEVKDVPLYKFRENIEKLFIGNKVRITYKDNSTEEKDVTSQNIIFGDTLAKGDNEIKISIAEGAPLIKMTFNATVDTVSSLYEKELGSETLLEGVVIAIAHSAAPEFIVVDEAGKIIGIRGIGSGGINSKNYNSNGFKVGDKILIPVVLNKQNKNEGTSNTERVYAQYNVSDDYKISLIEENVNVSLNKENAIEIDSQDDLINLLSFENRANNHYSYVKLHGRINFISYLNGNSLFYRFFFDPVRAYADQKIDGNCSAVFFDNTHPYTLGKTFSEVAFKEEGKAFSDWSNPGYVVGDIYCLFIGGNNYYHQFVLLSENDYIPETPVSIGEIDRTIEVGLNETFALPNDLTINYTSTFGTREVAVENAMLDNTTLPNTEVEGEYTVKGSYMGLEFTFIVKVVKVDEVMSLEDDVELTLGKYTWKKDIEKALVGKNALIKKNEALVKKVAITSEMLSFDDDKAEVIISHELLTLTLKVTLVDKPLTVTEFLEAEDGVYELTGIVVTPVSSNAYIELLLKDKDNDNIVSIYNSGVSGTYTAPEFKATKFNIGDEIVFTATKVTDAASHQYTPGKIHANVTAVTFEDSVTVISSSNSTEFDLDEMCFAVINNQEEFVEFLNTQNNVYKVVKLVGVRAVYYSNKDGVKLGYRIFFDKELTNNNVNSRSPYILINNAKCTAGNDLADIFNGADEPEGMPGDGSSYNSQLISTKDIYVCLIGGNKYYYAFSPLGSDWIVERDK